MVKGKIFLKAKASIMLVFFLVIFCNSNLFWHTHFINNNIIVHSHFYWGNNFNPDSNTAHTHTYKEVIQINILNHTIFNLGLGLIFIAGILNLLGIISVRFLNSTLEPFAIYYFLRGPPFVNYN